MILKTGTGNDWFDDKTARDYGFIYKKEFPAQLIGGQDLPARIEYRGILKDFDKGVRRFINPIKRFLLKYQLRRELKGWIVL